MNLLALSIAPGIAICIFIYFKDKFNKEPLGRLLISFVLGMCSTVPALIIQLISGVSLESLEGKGYQEIAIFAFGIVAVSEELCKFIVVRFYAFNKKSFDEPFDGIMYAVMVGMGFATLENIGYVYQHGVSTGIARMFLAVPAHATFAILMGYHFGLAKFDFGNRGKHFIMALFWPVLFHGAYDFFLFMGNSIIHIAGALISLFIAVRLSRKAIRLHHKLSENHAKGENIINDRDHSLL